MLTIKQIKTLKQLIDVFNFVSKTFYEDSVEYSECYDAMSEGYIEMKK